MDTLHASAFVQVYDQKTDLQGYDQKMLKSEDNKASFFIDFMKSVPFHMAFFQGTEYMKLYPWHLLGEPLQALERLMLTHGRKGGSQYRKMNVDQLQRKHNSKILCSQWRIHAVRSSAKSSQSFKGYLGSSFKSADARDSFFQTIPTFSICYASTNGSISEDIEEKPRTTIVTMKEDGKGPCGSATAFSSKGTLQICMPLTSEMDDNLDSPSEGFSTISEAIDAIRQGKFVVVVDDEDRENEGDLIMAGSLVTPEAIAFLVKHSTGIVCVSMKGEDLDQLRFPLMVSDQENEEAMLTAFTVSVDVKEGTSTGVSACDRAKTILAFSSPDSRPEDFRRPGHIFPLRYREGGVLKRAGHTEAALDLAVLAELPPVGVLCEIVNDDDGSMARLPRLREFTKKNNLPIISIADLVRYRRKREKLVECTGVARLPTKWGTFNAYCYKSKLDGTEHVAMVKGEIGDGVDVLVRVHSECLTGDLFGSKPCDCGNQLAQAMQMIQEHGRGVLVYLRGRGIGLGHKLQPYNLPDKDLDEVEVDVELGIPIDSREYGIGAQILKHVGVQTMRLMTNNPSRFLGLKGYGLAISRRVPLISPTT